VEDVTTYDATSYRPGSNPTFQGSTAGLDPTLSQQPVWHLMTRFLVGVLRQHFGTQAAIEDPAMFNRVWTNAPSSPITIASLAEWKPQDTQQRPAIYVDRLEQTVDMSKRSVGNQLHGLMPAFYNTIFDGSHVVHCLGGREGEAELLAHEVWRQLHEFAPQIQKELCLLRFLPVKVGKRVQFQSTTEQYSVPIEIIYGYQETWRIKNLSESQLNAIKLNI